MSTYTVYSSGMHQTCSVQARRRIAREVEHGMHGEVQHKGAALVDTSINIRTLDATHGTSDVATGDLSANSNCCIRLKRMSLRRGALTVMFCRNGGTAPRMTAAGESRNKIIESKRRITFEIQSDSNLIACIWRARSGCMRYMLEAR